jgi:hypothetical protein
MKTNKKKIKLNSDVLKAMLCTPRGGGGNDAGGLQLTSKPNDWLNWWQKVAYARRFRSPMKRYREQKEKPSFS